MMTVFLSKCHPATATGNNDKCRFCNAISLTEIDSRRFTITVTYTT